MDRVAVFVDAGYVFSAGGEALVGAAVKRHELSLKQEVLLDALRQLAERASGGLPLLRIYWYDGTSGRPSTQQTVMADCTNVKLRLGFVNAAGQQKGVDSLIVTDLIALARNRAMADALVVSGDEDLRVGVQQAQEWGVRVHLLRIEQHRPNQSINLRYEADTAHCWTAADVGSWLTHSPALSLAVPEAVVTPAAGADGAGSAPSYAGAATPTPMGGNGTGNGTSTGVQPPPVAATFAAQVAAQVAASVPEGDLPTLLTVLTPRSVPSDWDRLLLRTGAQALGVAELDTEQRRALRREFHAACERRVPAAGGGIVPLRPET